MYTPCMEYTYMRLYEFIEKKGKWLNKQINKQLNAFIHLHFH